MKDGTRLGLVLALALHGTGAVAEAPPPAPLVLPEVSITHFSAAADDAGRVRVRWETAYEAGQGVFLVRRQQPDGGFEPVGTGFLRLQGGDDPFAYEWPDPAARAGEFVRYALIFIPPGGAERWVAEWAGVIAERPPVALPAAAVATATASVAPVPLDAPQSWLGNGSRVRAWTEDAPADRVRLSLRDAGIYRVTAQELADAGGWETNDLLSAIHSTNLAMICQGEPVAWLPDGEGLLFHGLPPDSRFAPENVYWIAPGPGTNMALLATAPPPDPSTNAWFMDTVLWQGTEDTNYPDRYMRSTLADIPVSFVTLWGEMLTGKNKTIQVALTDYAPGVWSGAVTVNLISLYEVGTDQHRIRVSVGGTPVGTNSWSGERYVSFAFPFSSTNLASGLATLKLENTAQLVPWDAPIDYTRFLCVSFGFTYPRLFRARDGALRCTGGEGDLVAVAGFATNDIVALDVSEPGLPVVVGPVASVRDSATGSWTASFAVGGASRIYQVASRVDGLLQPAVRGVRDTDWSHPDQALAYAILIPPEGWRDDFRAAVQPLADFRNAQGLQTAVIDVESLYNAFTQGLADPEAIRRFCAATYPNGLRYLLLAGSGSLDYKYQRRSVNDLSACLIPSPVMAQVFPDAKPFPIGRIVTVDAALGLVDQDRLPDVAVGRLPTALTAEIAVAIQKTIAYEGALLWKQQASVAADWSNVGDQIYPFAAEADRLLIPPLADAGRLVVKHYVATENSVTALRNDSLFPALQLGSGLFLFFGHSNNWSLGDTPVPMLTINDMTSKWQKPPIAIVISCIPNRWQSMTDTVSILPKGLFAANTGFVAALGSTGDMLPDEGKALAAGLLTETGGTREPRLGDVLLRGLRQVAPAQSPERLLCFSLVGDPALVYRHDVTAMGTDAAWLAERGLTAPNEELADPDADGWPTWREYLSGTDPLANLLRITDARLTGGPVRTITFETTANSCYQVQTKTRLDGGDWQVIPWKLTNVPGWNASGTPISASAPVTSVDVPSAETAASGFYRIRSVEPAE